MTRTGKIARLPRHIREDLNRRLADGEIGRQLVNWLNSLPEVQEVMAAHFNSNPINEPNLTEWKQGGFVDWECHQEAQLWARQLVEKSDDLEAISGAVSLADRAAFPILLALDDVLQQVVVSADIIDQRETTLRVAEHLNQLRRANHNAERLRLDKERLAFKQEQLRRLERLDALKWNRDSSNQTEFPPAQTGTKTAPSVTRPQDRPNPETNPNSLSHPHASN